VQITHDPAPELDLVYTPDGEVCFALISTVIDGAYCLEIGKRSRKTPLSIHDLH